MQSVCFQEEVCTTAIPGKVRWELWCWRGAGHSLWALHWALGSALGSHLQRIPNRANMARAESKKRKGPGWSRPHREDVAFPSSLWGMGRGGGGTPRNSPTFGMKEKNGPKVQKSEQNTGRGLGLEAAWPCPSLLHMLSFSPRTAGRGEQNRGTGGLRCTWHLCIGPWLSGWGCSPAVPSSPWKVMILARWHHGGTMGSPLPAAHSAVGTATLRMLRSDPTP